ncbi:MAG: hypothetical protein ACERNK_09390, partial [Deltaproteobacteria bacterium]
MKPDPQAYNPADCAETGDSVYIPATVTQLSPAKIRQLANQLLSLADALESAPVDLAEEELR